MRKLYDKNDFIRVVRELKKIRRDFDTVNQRCQQELGRLGFYYVEFINPSFMSEVSEHSISVVNSDEYGTLLIYGMNPQTVVLSTKVRLYCIGVDIPEFHRKKTDDEIKEQVEKETMKSKSFDFDEMPKSLGMDVTANRKTKSKISSKSMMDTYFGTIVNVRYDDENQADVNQQEQPPVEDGSDLNDF